jgi:hypothetical protein
MVKTEEALAIIGGHVDEEFPFGRLIVEVDPQDAVIELDGKMMPRQNPLTLNEVEVGAHKLKIIAPEYLPYEELIVIRRGEDTHVNKQLTPNYSNLNVIVLDQEGAPIKAARVLPSKILKSYLIKIALNNTSLKKHPTFY